MSQDDYWVDPVWSELQERYRSGYRPTEEELATLPVRQAAVLRLRTRDRRGYQESRERIGQRLGISTRAVQGAETAALWKLQRRAYPSDRVISKSGRP